MHDVDIAQDRAVILHEARIHDGMADRRIAIDRGTREMNLREIGRFMSGEVIRAFGYDAVVRSLHVDELEPEPVS
ncbi:MAG: hypothetical protein WDN24_15385 [Sphingomonas sp.]